MAGGGDFPDREGAGRPGRAPAPPLSLMGPLGHPRHACPRLPRRRPRRRTHPPGLRRPHSTDLQRDPAPVHRARRPAAVQRGSPPALVRVEMTSSSSITHQSLPATSRLSDMKITIYSWSTSLHFGPELSGGGGGARSLPRHTPHIAETEGVLAAPANGAAPVPLRRLVALPCSPHSPPGRAWSSAPAVSALP